ncbi:MAG: tRNA adenosine deaminase-associated protein [Aeromicrobium sp.]
MAEDDVDFAVAAYHDEGRWQVVELDPRLGEDIDDLREALGRFPSDVGVLGLVSMNDDFFVIVRRSGVHVRVMLSDVTAIDDWPLAGGVADLLDLAPGAGADGDAEAVGDLEILSDLGMTGSDLGALCDDDDLYPDDVLLDVAERLGFGGELEAVLG